jgi:hypothetical protein
VAVSEKMIAAFEMREVAFFPSAFLMQFPLFIFHFFVLFSSFEIKLDFPFIGVVVCGDSEKEENSMFRDFKLLQSEGDLLISTN